MDAQKDDAAAVEAVLAGDRDAFRFLVERHSRNVFRLAFRMTSNEQDAEEVVQEAFLRAYSRLSKFEARSSFGTWIYRIAANCSLDLLDRRKRKKEQQFQLDENEEHEMEIQSDNPDPERMLLSAQFKEKVSEAMAQLSPVERTAFLLRHLEGCSIEEIGKTLQLRTSATKNTIFRAVKKMRSALEPMAMRTIER